MNALKTLTLGACSAALMFLSACETAHNVADNLSEIDLPASTRIEPTPEALITKGGCPSAQIAPDLETVHDFSSSAVMNDETKMSSALITRINSSCEYKDFSLIADLQVNIAGALGPHGRLSASDAVTYSHPFFVAITSPGGKILAKEVFDVRLTYEPGQTTNTKTESIRQIIPLTDREIGKDYVVLVGFQMHRAQLEYNREAARIRAEQEKARAKAARAAGQNVSVSDSAHAVTSVPVVPTIEPVITREEITTIEIDKNAPIQLAPEHENVQRSKP